MGEFASDYNGLDKKTYLKKNKKGLAYGSEYFTPSMPTEAAKGAVKAIKKGATSQYVGDKAKAGAKRAVRKTYDGSSFAVKDVAGMSSMASEGYIRGVSRDTYGDDGGSDLIDAGTTVKQAARYISNQKSQKKAEKIQKAKKFSAKFVDTEYTKAIANGDFKKFEEKMKAADRGFNVSDVVRKTGPADSHEAYKAFRKKANQKKFSMRLYKKYHKLPAQQVSARLKSAASKMFVKGKNLLLELLKKPYLWAAAGAILVITLVFDMLVLILSSLFVSDEGSGLSSTYLSDDSEILACEQYYSDREDQLKEWLDNIRVIHPGYDEYDLSDVANIEHNPYVVASYLNALLHEPFTASGVKGEMDHFFETQYRWYTNEEWVEREEHDRDEYGNILDTTHTVRIHILHVHLINNGEVKTAYSLLDKESGQRFSAQVSVKGQKAYLWDGHNIDETEGINNGARQVYKVPNNILRDDPAFAALYRVGASLIDTPYVWGGTDPSGFDCSGFVSYVYTESGYAYMPRLTAQQIYDRCTRLSADEVMPGDLVFLTGTYATSKDVTHVAIYVGNNMVLNCGDPVKYCNITTGWWKRHFYAYGRYNE